MSCQVVSHICKFAWFHIEDETGRLMITLRGDLTDFDQPIIDRVDDLPDDVRAAFLSKIDGKFAIEPGEGFDRVVRVVDEPVALGGRSEYGYGCGRYNGD